MRTFTFHCKFDADFWTEKFADIGIPVKIEMAENQSRAYGSLHTLIVTFLEEMESTKALDSDESKAVLELEE